MFQNCIKCNSKYCIFEIKIHGKVTFRVYHLYLAGLTSLKKLNRIKDSYDIITSTSELKRNGIMFVEVITDLKHFAK
jgi:hypothetical protein